MNKQLSGIIIILLASCTQNISSSDDSVLDLDTIISRDYSVSVALEDSILLPELKIKGSCETLVNEGDSCHFTARLSDSTFYKFYDEKLNETHVLLPIVRIQDEEVEINRSNYSASTYVTIEPPYKTYSNTDKRYKEVIFEWTFLHPKGGDIELTRVIRFELEGSH